MAQEINCQQFLAQIDSILDQRGSLSDNPALAGHAGRCTDCMQLLNDYTIFCQPMPAVARSAASVSVNDHSTSANPITAWFNRSAAMIASLAAVLVVAISLSTMYSSSFSVAFVYGGVEGENVPVASTTQRKSRDLFRPLRPYVQESLTLIQSKTSEGQRTIAANLMKPAHLTASINEISEQFHPLNAYYRYSVELPGVRPVRTSLNATLEIIQQSIDNEQAAPPKNPDLGLLPPTTDSIT